MKLWTLFLCLLVGFGSCKKKTESETAPEGTSVILSEDQKTTDDENSSEKIKDCDDFVDQYEAWSEEYIAFMAKYKDDPMKAVTSPDYSKMMQKASSWSQQWLSISVSCAQNSRYEERVEEIANKMDKKLEELGFK